MKQIGLAITLFLSITPLLGMEQPHALVPQQAADEAPHISSESVGSLNESYRTDAMLKQNTTELARIRYFLYKFKVEHSSNEYYRAIISEITVTDAGNFYTRCRNYFPCLPLILVAHAIKDLITLHAQQKKSEELLIPSLEIKSEYSEAKYLLLREFGFETFYTANEKPAFNQLLVTAANQFTILNLCEQQLAKIRPSLVSNSVPAKVPSSDSTSSEEELPLKPAAAPAVIPQAELRKNALARLRNRQNGKVKLPRTELEAMAAAAKTGYWPIKGISKKTSSKTP